MHCFADFMVPPKVGHRPLVHTRGNYGGDTVTMQGQDVTSP